MYQAPSLRQLLPCFVAFVVSTLHVLPLQAGTDLECVRASDYHDEEGLHSTVSLGNVVFEAPIGENGVANPLNILDCDADGTLELFITVSPESTPRSRAKPAEMRFRRACVAGSPTLVSFLFTQGGLTATWRAYTADGTLVDTASSGVSGTKQTVVLAHPDGIARVEIVGIRLCIESICWDCTQPVLAEEGCADPADAFNESGVVSVAHIGAVTITESTFPNGNPAPMAVFNCDGDSGLELFIRWSLNPIAPVRFFFPVGCQKELFPPAASIRFHQGSPSATWNAFDTDGVLVDSTVTTPGAGLQTVAFNSPNGIRRVEVHGFNLCIDAICWRCGSTGQTPQFRRGDADASGDLSLNDAVRTLNFLFLGNVRLACEDAADTDDSGELGIADAMRTLGFLFLGSPMPSGANTCSIDATEDKLGCEAYSACNL